MTSIKHFTQLSCVLLLTGLLAACGSDLFTSEAPAESPAEALTSQATFGGYSVDIVTTNEWSDGFQGAVVLANESGAAVESFEITFELGGDNTISQSWNGSFSAPQGGVITLTSPDFLANNKIAQGSSFESGFVASNAFAGGTVTGLKVNGETVGGGATDPVDPVDPVDPTDPTDPVTPDEELCEDFASIEVGPYIYQNNTWGADKLDAGETFTQCLVTRTVDGEREIGWTWDWPGLEPTVYSYPEIIYGWKPWSGGANTDPINLPVQAGDVGDIDLTFDFDQDAQGSYNMAAEVWFTGSGEVSAEPNANDITTEIMFWVNSSVQPAGTNVGEITVGGETYEVWYLEEIGAGSKPNGDGWRYVAYRSTSQQSAGTLALDEFIQDSVDRGYLSEAEYLVTIEMGNEVSGGTGTTYFKNYDISFGTSTTDPADPDPTGPTDPAPAAGGAWTAEDGRILLDGEPVWINGLNWFGFDAGDHKLHGLWTGRPMGDFLDQIDGYGFNALRIPLCPATINPGTVVDDAAYAEYGETAQEQFKSLLSAMNERDMYALLDIHTYDCGNHLTGTMLDSAYGEDAWLEDIETLATISQDFPNVMGIDVYNEPHKLTWDNFAELSSEAGQAALAINSDLLIFVEGVGNESPSGEWGANWGGNLFNAAQTLPDLPTDKLVFSPHAYGPSVAAQDYFEVSNFPNNMPEVWDSHFGYLQDAGYTVIPGEFGGRYTGEDKVWQDAFIDYIGEKEFGGFFYWSLNPNSGDTGGLLLDDWESVDQGKLDLLENIIR